MKIYSSKEPHSRTTKKTLEGFETPSWLQTIQGVFDPITYLEKGRARYGDIFKGKGFGYRQVVFLGHPDAIEQAFAANPDCFDSFDTGISSKQRVSTSTKCFDSGIGNAMLEPVLGDRSILLLDGAAHQQQRKLLMPPFHGERMRTYGHTICQITEGVSDQWSKNKPFLMRTQTQEIALRVIIRAVFGVKDSSRFERMRELLGAILDTFGSAASSSLLFVKVLQQDLGDWSPWGKFLRRIKAINELIFTEIRDRQTQPPGEDILSLMMAARDENGEAMTELELRDELISLLVAGHETTASALAWAFYLIHRNPEVLERLLEEFNGLDPETDPSAIALLPYLSAVCSETLRMYPLTIFASIRLLKAPMEIMGYYLEEGTALLPCIYLVHQREDLYPNPKQFRPERFLERDFSPYEYFPFGGGKRFCIGHAFALFEMKLVLATVLKQVKLGLLEKRPIKSTRRGMVLTPSSGVRMMVVNSY